MNIFSLIKKCFLKKQLAKSVVALEIVSFYNKGTLWPSPNIMAELAQLDQTYFPIPWQKTQWLEMEMSPSAYQLNLAYQNKNLVGFILLEIHKYDDLAHLQKILILPTFRKEGYAYDFLKQLMRMLLENNIKRIFLEVSTENCAALALYRKMGFVSLHRAKRYYPTGEDAFVLEKHLQS